MKSIIKTYRIKKTDIAYLKFILEGYEGMAVMRTIDPLQAIVALHIAPGAEKDVSLLLEKISDEISIEKMESTINDSDIWEVGRPSVSGKE